jgi:hypothetical protein
MVKGAKPTAILCGYAVDGLGFYYIPYTSKQKVAISEPKEAFISVSDRVLSTAQITRELERLVPGWKWVVEEREDKTFSTTFPSAAELQCMIEWGPVHAKGAKGILKITAKKDHAVYKYEIPKAWAQFRGLPDDLREFPILWALGTIFGATREVDMKFTKHFGRPRVKVAVLNPELIPEFVDIVIGDYVYELQVRVESETEEFNPLPIDMDTQAEDGNKNLGKMLKMQMMQENQNLIQGRKKVVQAIQCRGEIRVLCRTKKNMQDPEPVLLEAQADPVIAQQEGKPICAAQPMALVGDQQLRANGPEAEKGLSDASPGNKSRPMFQLELAASESTRAWVAKAFVNSANDKSVTPKSPNSPSKLTMQNAMPKSASVTPRKSKRSTAFADQNSIEKAAKLKAKKNLEEPNQKGMTAVDSFGCVHFAKSR